MKAIVRMRHEFVEHIPQELREGTLYVSIQFSTAVHKCCCGCGNEVVTPLTPTDWKLIFDGETVSLSPSIGNWSFQCQSHYWIDHGNIRWAPRWSQEEIDDGRARDREAKNEYFSKQQKLHNQEVAQVNDMSHDAPRGKDSGASAKKR